MYELLPEIRSVPIDRDSLTTVHRGMNKVRVSVGDHISEPSEVYIITGQTDGKFESYVIFYMLEPGIHVVYGYEQNPYAPSMKEQVTEEAIIFVEEMGSILEEVPWETMTPDQRSAWAEKEILYSAPVIEELEEVEEIESAEVAEAEEISTAETPADEDATPDAESGVVEVSEEELAQVLSENGTGEMSSEPREDGDDRAGKGVDGVDTEGMEDVVVAEGDFDELLKQAFLKPDVAEKTKRKGGGPKAARAGKGPPMEETAAEDDEEIEVEGDAQRTIAGRTAEAQEGAGPVPKAAPAAEAAGMAETTPGGRETALSEKDTILKVIRFLSRF